MKLLQLKLILSRMLMLLIDRVRKMKRNLAKLRKLNEKKKITKVLQPVLKRRDVKKNVKKISKDEKKNVRKIVMLIARDIQMKEEKMIFARNMKMKLNLLRLV